MQPFQVKVGMHFSELSHYTVLKVDGEVVELRHHASGDTIGISRKYLQNYCLSPYTYFDEMIVGKEDKHWTEKQITDQKIQGVRVGDLRLSGIKSIFRDIAPGEVFTVVFRKAEKTLTKKEVESRRQNQIKLVKEKIAALSVSSLDTGVAEIIAMVQKHPVLTYEPGELRTLVGYKLTSFSPDGFYKVIDLDAADPQERLVNVNTIQEIIYKNVKYILE